MKGLKVHHYDKVDAEIVVGILRKDLKDFAGYRDAIVNFLKANNNSNQ